MEIETIEHALQFNRYQTKTKREGGKGKIYAIQSMYHVQKM